MTSHREKPLGLSDEQYEAAEAMAQWHLGDPDWAWAILDAAQNPDATWKRLHAAGMQRQPVSHEARE